MQAAPLFEELADGPAGGKAWWLTTNDGRRIRIGLWPEGAKGTVLLFPGRTEYIEKYGRAAEDFRQRGFATLTVDWRGQGLADRLVADRSVGYVGQFSDYQLDVQTIMAALPDLNLPEPFYLLGHSMGGCIGLRALMDGLPVKAACFSGPMWGILIPPLMRPAARAIAYAGRQLGMGTRYAPGSSGTAPYPEAVAFDGNNLTCDPQMYDYMLRQTLAQPDLGLGGPSLQWVHEAFVEMRALRQRPSPPVPAVTFLGSDESIVCPEAIRDRMARWPGGQLEIVDGGRHEVMMETPRRRQYFFDTTTQFYETCGPVALSQTA